MESKMNSQFTIRLDDITNQRTIEQAQALGLTRAKLVRTALTSFLDNPNPKEDSEIVAVLKEQLSKAHLQIEAANESKERADVITLQLTATMQIQQKQLQHLTKPKSFFERLRTVFN